MRRFESCKNSVILFNISFALVLKSLFDKLEVKSSDS